MEHFDALRCNVAPGGKDISKDLLAPVEQFYGMNVRAKMVIRVLVRKFRFLWKYTVPNQQYWRF